MLLAGPTQEVGDQIRCLQVRVRYTFVMGCLSNPRTTTRRFFLDEAYLGLIEANSGGTQVDSE